MALTDSFPSRSDNDDCNHTTGNAFNCSGDIVRIADCCPNPSEGRNDTNFVQSNQKQEEMKVSSDEQNQDGSTGPQQHQLQQDQLDQKPPKMLAISFDRDQLLDNGLEPKLNESKAPLIKTSKKRYFILLMFVLLHMIKSFQWICLASITNVAARFYRVDNMTINWTTILFMVTFLILALPTSWIMEQIGLRKAVLIGASGVTCGVIIKCFSCDHDGIWYYIFGHLIVGLAEPFFFSSCSQVASVWFPDHQVAMATAWSVIGEQFGLALGFIIPPLMIGSDPDDELAIQMGLFRLFVALACISTLNTISIMVFFEEKPKFAPGFARAKQIEQEENRRRNSQAAISEQMQRKILEAVLSGEAKKHNNSNNLKCKSTNNSNGLSQDKIISHDPSDIEAKTRRRSESPRVVALRTRLELGQCVSQQILMAKDMVLNENFLMLLFGFGLNAGTVYSIHTLLNQMITQSASPSSWDHSATSDTSMIIGNAGNNTSMNNRLLNSSRLILDVNNNNPDDGSSSATAASIITSDIFHSHGRWADDDVNLITGNAGLISILAGLFGSAFCGFILDKYHRYKLTTAVIYLMTLISMIALTFSLKCGNSYALYLVSFPLGFAFTGYLSCGFDYGVEITYPHPGLLSSTLLNISAQICGIPISLIGSLIVDNHGSDALGAFFCAILLVGFLASCLQGGELRRQSAVKECNINLNEKNKK